MEEWTRWEPIQGLEGKYYLKSFAWKETGFIVELISEEKGKKIEILFDDYIDTFRYTNESFYLKILDNASSKDDIDFYKNFSLFKVTNSEYLAWISEKSCTLSNNMNFIHFCILGGDEFIDIVTNYEPKVTIIDYKLEIKIYSKKEFGLELKEKIKNRENLARIGRWAFSVFRDNFHNIDNDFKELLKDLSSMEDGPEFEYSYEELNRIADKLIAGENVKL